MELIDGSDAEWPQGALPGEVACGYIGGWAGHVWTSAEWRSQTADFLLPIYVAHVDLDPVNAGHNCVALLKRMGMPEGFAYALDAETDTDVGYEWVNDFADATAPFHVGCHPYASADSIEALPVRAGYWVADWTGHRHMSSIVGADITQWTNTGNIDLDVFNAEMRLWRNPHVRH